MNFDLEKSLEILERTPDVLRQLLFGIDESWIFSNEGEESWSPFDIVGHLIHGEKTDWMQRVEIILNEGDKKFAPFDRFAQFEESKGKNLQQLLDEFSKLRKANIAVLSVMNFKEEDFNKIAIHPKFGEVTLRQLFSTWSVHDLSHIAQICRVMAKQYKFEVGPWIEYIPLLQK